jgi:hypothetical protein
LQAANVTGDDEDEGDTSFPVGGPGP